VCKKQGLKGEGGTPRRKGNFLEFGELFTRLEGIKKNTPRRLHEPSSLEERTSTEVTPHEEEGRNLSKGINKQELSSARGKRGQFNEKSTSWSAIISGEGVPSQHLLGGADLFGGFKNRGDSEEKGRPLAQGDWGKGAPM